MPDLYGMNSPSRKQPWTDVAVFEDLRAGRAVEALLTRQGLQARIYDDKFLRTLLFLRPPRATFRLQVHTADFDRAHEILQSGPKNGLRYAIHCPDCGSRQVSYPQMTRKFMLPTILLHAGILLRLVDHQCYCERCHCMWSLRNRSSVVPEISGDAWPNAF